MEGVGDLLERDEARARLEAALAAARRGQGRIVSLEGEAGIGKTALLLSFMEAVRGDVRVHLGHCENLATPEPFGPLRDVARESQGRFAVSPTGAFATYESLLRLLTSGRGPAVLALEDVHWADDATLDALRFLGRRIRAAPVVVLVTFRSDEPHSRARLASLWADLPRDARERIELNPLSPDAVARLARRAGRAAREVHAATGGNPFHVNEYLASEGDGVPSGVQAFTVARAARLTPLARRTLECASIFPRQIDEATLRRVADDVTHAGVEECLASGMLQARGGALAFQHELARRAVNESISPLRRRELHQSALALLKGRNDQRAAEIAHHAEQAGDVGDLVRYSVRAAAEAGAVGAYREAVAHLSRAIEHGGASLSAVERAQLLERKAMAANFSGALGEAVQALDEAIAVYRREDDLLGVGNALRISAHVHWNLGDPALAERHMYESVRVLEDARDSWQYALAVASLAQCDMLADRNEQAIAAAEKAVALAERLGRWDIVMQALNFLRTSRAATNLDEGVPALRATIEEARRRGELDALPRLYGNLTTIMTAARRHDGLMETIEEGIAICAARDHVPIEALLRGNRAAVLLDTGQLPAALSEAEDVVHGPYPKIVGTLPAVITASRARRRLGLPDGGLLDQARRLPAVTRDLLWRAPIAIAEAEAEWLDGSEPGAAGRLAQVLDGLLTAWSQLWYIAETALWLTILGRPPALPPRALAALPAAHRAHIEERWRDAAELWAARGCPYEQAIALANGDEDDQRQALLIFDRLGAAPAARNLRRRMRADGVRSVPSGPRTARRDDPAGLTPRQNEVLALLADGLANAEIAARLKLSAKTVEHHVGAILAALEAPNRLAAVNIARDRGLTTQEDA
jgi:DNA-binding CsgD family transcriptional regulator/tetratricopeptide (TPR) repeat protein